jgi:quinol monooxygenase YgiN
VNVFIARTPAHVIGAELFRGTARPDTVVLLERWSDSDTFDAHAQLNRTRTPVGRDLVDGRARLERFDV